MRTIDSTRSTADDGHDHGRSIPTSNSAALPIVRHYGAHTEARMGKVRDDASATT